MPLGSTKGDANQRLEMEIAAQPVPCTGVSARSCLLVRIGSDTRWTRFYDAIDGFSYEPGYQWRIEVDRGRVLNPPMDGSAFAYRLVRVQSKSR